MVRRYMFLAFLCLCFLIAPGLSTSLAGAAERQGKAVNTDLERFLPSDGNTVYQATGLLRAWPMGGPRELWRRGGLAGKSAVAEAGGRAFTLAQIDGKQYGVCLDPLNGKVLWKHLLIPKKNTHFKVGPITSPVVDGDRVYFVPYDNERNFFKPRCPLICVKADGSELWRKHKNVWVTEGSTPLIVGDVLYVASSHPETVMMAVDKMTGKRLWATACPMRGKFAGKDTFSAPASVTYQKVGGIPQVICSVYYSHEVLGIHAESGKLMWRWPLPSPPKCGLISTPVALGNRLFLSAADGPGQFSACLEMKVKGGKLAPRELYRSKKIQCNRFNTVAIYEGAVYGFGHGPSRQALQCTNFADGKLLWQRESPDWDKNMQLMIADGLMFAIARKGEVVLIEPNRKGYRELGRVNPKIKMGFPQQPLLANGRLYIRGDDTIVCYQVVEKMLRPVRRSGN